jgi:hypothetical protein
VLPRLASIVILLGLLLPKWRFADCRCKLREQRFALLPIELPGVWHVTKFALPDASFAEPARLQSVLAEEVSPELARLQDVCAEEVTARDATTSAEDWSSAEEVCDCAERVFAAPEEVCDCAERAFAAPEETPSGAVVLAVVCWSARLADAGREPARPSSVAPVVVVVEVAESEESAEVAKSEEFVELEEEVWSVAVVLVAVCWSARLADAVREPARQSSVALVVVVVQLQWWVLEFLLFLLKSLLFLLKSLLLSLHQQLLPEDIVASEVVVATDATDAADATDATDVFVATLFVIPAALPVLAVAEFITLSVPSSALSPPPKLAVTMLVAAPVLTRAWLVSSAVWSRAEEIVCALVCPFAWTWLLASPRSAVMQDARLLVCSPEDLLLSAESPAALMKTSSARLVDSRRSCASTDTLSKRPPVAISSWARRSADRLPTFRSSSSMMPSGVTGFFPLFFSFF